MDPTRAVRPLKPSIHLLKSFISAGTLTDHTLLWQTVIHVVFLVSAVSIAFIDRLLQVPSKHGSTH